MVRWIDATQGSFKETFAEIALEEKNKISHRGKALELVKEFLEKNSDELIASLDEVDVSGGKK